MANDYDGARRDSGRFDSAVWLEPITRRNIDMDRDRVMDHFEKLGFAIMVVFGAIIIGGLMAVGVVWQDKAAFLYALSAAVAVWVSSFAVVFDRPRIFGGLLVVSIVMIGFAVTAIVT